MIVRVSELPDEGLSIDETAFPSSSPYADRAWRLESLELRLDRDGDEVDVRGQIRASVPQECARCAEPVISGVVADVDLRFAPRPDRVDDAELGRDDLDTDFYTDDQLDVGAIVANETTVALPMKPLCSADCRGLCPACGANRNVTSCTCAERAPDPRLAVLKTLAGKTQK